VSEPDGGRPERDDRDDRGRSRGPGDSEEPRGSGWSREASTGTGGDRSSGGSEGPGSGGAGSGDRASDDRRPDDRRADGRRPEDRRPEDRRPEDRRSEDRRSGGRSDNRAGRPAGDRRGGSGGDRRGQDRGRDERGRDDRGGDRPRGQGSGDDRARDDRPRPDRSRDDRPRSDRRDDRPRTDRPRDDRPRTDRPREDRGGFRDRGPRSGGGAGGRDRGPGERGAGAPRSGGHPDRRDGRGAGDRDGRRERPSGPRNSGPPRGRENPAGPPSGDPARQAAFDLLTAVRERDAYANLLLPSILRRYGLRDRDAALATELGYGTLRAQGQLDAAIEACADRPLHRIEGPLVDAMRLGAYQLLRMRVPEHAAVATSVDIVRGLAGTRSSGFVNAILRKVAENVGTLGADAWITSLAPSEEEDPIGRASFLHAHPKWIGQAFVDALGSREELDAALAADDTRPVVHLLARPGDITAEELALVTGGTEAPYSPYGVHLEPGSGDIGEIDAIREGLAVVQDEGSQLVALALSRAELVGEDTGRWLDLCAGPGGKAVLLGGLVALDGGTLDAVESSEHRADLVRRAVDGLPVAVHTADGREAPLPDGAYDRVLVDAPCTGLGALRRRPEARWRRTPEDVAGLAKLQRDLLLAGLRHVRVGGVVAYVTCSPHLAETVGVVGGLVRRKDLGVGVERVDARPYLPGVPQLGEGPTVQLWPHRHGTDAMFLALLRRTS